MLIPIQNIYFLLSYSWEKLDMDGEKIVSADENLELLELLIRVLIHGLTSLFKHGLDKNYQSNQAIYTGIKGKVNLADSIKKNTLSHRQTVCDYDEWSADILSNQILKTTLENLLRTSQLRDEKLKQELHQFWFRFSEVQRIQIQKIDYRKVRYHRNNRHYVFLINVCQLINENLLPDETTGDLIFQDFIRDERKMAHLFEDFVRKFYQIEQQKYDVQGNERIDWQLISQNQNAIQKLPKMFTDISLENATQKIILDTKFYQNPMNGSRFRPENLYQLFAYLKNQEEDGNPKTQNCTGILLYATVQEDFDYAYTFENHRIKVCSVNLSLDAKSIKKQLLNLIFTS